MIALKPGEEHLKSKRWARWIRGRRTSIICLTIALMLFQLALHLFISLSTQRAFAWPDHDEMVDAILGKSPPSQGVSAAIPEVAGNDAELLRIIAQSLHKIQQSGKPLVQERRGDRSITFSLGILGGPAYQSGAICVATAAGGSCDDVGLIRSSFATGHGFDSSGTSS